MSYGRFERQIRHLANAEGPKKLAYVKEKQLLYKMHERNWSKGTLVNDWRRKGLEVVVMGKVSGEDNSVVASVESPATMQEPVRRIGKRVFYRNNMVEFNFLSWLSCKVKTIDKTSSEAFFAKSGPPFRTSSEDPNSKLGF